MAYRWSVLENDEVWVDEHDEDEEICAECGEMTWSDALRWDDETPFCIDCYDEVFGGSAELQWRFANQDKTNEGSINELIKEMDK